MWFREKIKINPAMEGANHDSIKRANVRRLQPKDSDHELLDSKVVIPDDERYIGFSFRKLWAFTGPGLLMSIAFLDPGNIEADLQSGAQVRYQLFWVLFWATLLGLLVQRLSARVGVVAGQHMAEVCHSEYRPVWRILIWIMMEIAIIGSDMQEVIGTAIAIYLLSQGRVPLWGGVLITVVDTFTFIFLDKYGLRKLELFFAVLITTMAITFGFEFFLSNPDYGEIAEGIALPVCSNCNSQDLLQAVGIVGSCIMPHNLYLHSGLVKTREIDRSKHRKISEANFYFFIESGIALFISFIINLFVMAVFAKGLWGKTNSDIHKICEGTPTAFFHGTFHNNSDPVTVDIESGGVFLGCRYGLVAIYIWSIGILAAGQSSTMTGCYAGQFTMEGFLNLTWVRWKRVLFTRSMALLPTLYVASFSNLSAMSALNDFLNALMSIQLPFAVLPAIAFSSNKYIMGEFANGICNKILAVLIFLLISGMNGVLVGNFIPEITHSWPLWSQIIVLIYGVIYISICIFLLMHTVAALTDPDSCLNKSKFMLKYILGKSMTEEPIVKGSTMDMTSPPYMISS